jgi:hypothetical protein
MSNRQSVHPIGHEELLTPNEVMEYRRSATYRICGTSPVLSNTKGQYKGDVPLV